MLRLKIIFILTLISFLPNASRSQIEYSLIRGKTYKVTLINKQELTGNFVKQDSNSVSFNSENILMTIEKKNIYKISEDINGKGYRYLTSLLAGEAFYQYPGNFFMISANASYFFTGKNNIGIEFNYQTSNVEPQYYAQELINSGFKKNNYDIILNFQFGDFEKSNKIDFYFKTGAGVHIEHTSPGIMRHFYFYDSSFQTYNSPSYTKTYPLLQIGGGLIAKLSKNIGINAEIDINIISRNYYYFLTNGSVYLPFKAGLTYYFKN